MGGKNLLPYSVTPPKPRGPTEAERKIEEMTRQIEEEMEKREEEGEYFGEWLCVNLLLTPQNQVVLIITGYFRLNIKLAPCDVILRHT